MSTSSWTCHVVSVFVNKPQSKATRIPFSQTALKWCRSTYIASLWVNGDNPRVVDYVIPYINKLHTNNICDKRFLWHISLDSKTNRSTILVLFVCISVIVLFVRVSVNNFTECQIYFTIVYVVCVPIVVIFKLEYSCSHAISWFTRQRAYATGRNTVWRPITNHIELI